MKINEIFYSIQGEGRFTGCPAIFVRFSGCNLKCSFCDTDFSEYQEMSETEVVDAIGKSAQKQGGEQCKFVVLTGGEPTIQVTDSFVALLHYYGYYVAIETNGAYKDANELGVDWVTCSPKDYYTGSELKISRANEIKVVMDADIPESYLFLIESKIKHEYAYIQPCDTGYLRNNKEINQRVVDFVLKHPHWCISLQTQKILDVR